MRGPALTLLLTAILLLAGCAAPPSIPEDAHTAVQPGLDGLQLSAWTEQRDGITYLRAVVENDGTETYETKEDCGYLWQSELRDANGTLHTYKEPNFDTCDWFYDFLRPGDHREFLHSWDGQVWNDEAGADAEAGNWTWTIRFLLRDGAKHGTLEPVAGRFIELVVPFQI